MFQRLKTAHAPGVRLRVVVETDDPSLIISDFAAFSAAGLDVSLCGGPGHDTEGCPLLRGERCGLLEGSDVIFHKLGAGGVGPEVLRALCEAGEPVPVVVTIDDQSSAVPQGCIPLVATASVAGQIHAVRRAALSHRAAVGPPAGSVRG